jgi:mono/diheme cytochrome c family protein
MKNNSFWFGLGAAVVALMAPAVAVYAQGGARNGGGRDGGAIGNKPAPTSPVTGNAAAGKGLYYSYGCYACHGYNGETGARAFVGRWGNLETEQTFITFLRGRANLAPVTPAQSMPNFSVASLPDKQAKDIYAYIRTFKSTAPPLKDIPTLNAIVAAAKQDKQ